MSKSETGSSPVQREVLNPGRSFCRLRVHENTPHRMVRSLVSGQPTEAGDDELRACKAVNGQLLLQIHELNEVIKEVNREKKQLVKQVESLWKNSPVKGEGTNDHDWKRLCYVLQQEKDDLVLQLKQKEASLGEGQKADTLFKELERLSLRNTELASALNLTQLSRTELERTALSHKRNVLDVKNENSRLEDLLKSLVGERDSLEARLKDSELKLQHEESSRELQVQELLSSMQALQEKVACIGQEKALCARALEDERTQRHKLEQGMASMEESFKVEVNRLQVSLKESEEVHRQEKDELAKRLLTMEKAKTKEALDLRERCAVLQAELLESQGQYRDSRSMLDSLSTKRLLMERDFQSQLQKALQLTQFLEANNKILSSKLEERQSVQQVQETELLGLREEMEQSTSHLLAKLDGHVSESSLLKQQLAEQEAQVCCLKEQVSSQSTHIVELEELLQQQTSEVARLEDSLEKKQQDMSKLRSLFSEPSAAVSPLVLQEQSCGRVPVSPPLSSILSRVDLQELASSGPASPVDCGSSEVQHLRGRLSDIRQCCMEKDRKLASLQMDMAKLQGSLQAMATIRTHLVEQVGCLQEARHALSERNLELEGEKEESHCRLMEADEVIKRLTSRQEEDMLHFSQLQERLFEVEKMAGVRLLEAQMSNAQVEHCQEMLWQFTREAVREKSEQVLVEGQVVEYSRMELAEVQEQSRLVCLVNKTCRSQLEQHEDTLSQLMGEVAALRARKAAVGQCLHRKEAASSKCQFCARAGKKIRCLRDRLHTQKKQCNFLRMRLGYTLAELRLFKRLKEQLDCRTAQLQQDMASSQQHYQLCLHRLQQAEEQLGRTV